jgi:hypothetical protein
MRLKERFFEASFESTLEDEGPRTVPEIEILPITGSSPPRARRGASVLRLHPLTDAFENELADLGVGHDVDADPGHVHADAL